MCIVEPSASTCLKLETWLKYAMTIGRLSNRRFAQIPRKRAMIGAAIVATTCQLMGTCTFRNNGYDVFSGARATPPANQRYYRQTTTADTESSPSFVGTWVLG